jgi:uncharacterized protein (TIGR03435 family)
LIAGGSAGQSVNLQPGSAPPEIVLAKILQAPPETKVDWQGLRSKVVVLEFWATWCAPCIAQQPHLNQLAERFSDKQVQFISITDEPEEIVAPFLKRRTVKGWVGIDLKKSTFKAFGISGIPRTFVIDPKGKIFASMSGTQEGERLDENMLNQLIAGSTPAGVIDVRQPVIPAKPGQLIGPDETKAPDNEVAILNISIRPSKETTSTTIVMPNAITATGADLNSLLQSLLRVNPTHLSTPVEMQGKRYDVIASLQNEKTQGLRDLVVSALENALGIRVERVTREMDAFVLAAPKELTGSLQPTKAKSFHASTDDGVLAASAASPSQLVAQIEEVIKAPVIDETHLQGKFDWDLLYDGKNPRSILEAVRQQLGLELLAAKRQVELVIVEKK